MSRRFLLASAAVFAVLLAVAIPLLRRPPEPGPEPFLALARRQPDTLMIAFGPDTTVLVPGGRTGWSVIRPVSYPADGVSVSAIVKRLADLPVGERRFPLLPEKLDTYGMRLPRVTLRAAYTGGIPPDSLLVGGFTPNGAYYYVRVGGREEVALLPSHITRSYLLKTTRDLRQTRFMPFHETRAVALRLMGEDGGVTLAVERGEDDRWRVIGPYPGSADQDRTREYLSALGHMHIDAFLREEGGDFAPFGLDPGRLGAEVVTRAGDTLRVFLGKPVPGPEGLVYARRREDPVLLAVSAKYVPVLRTPAGSFREPSLFPFGLGDVDSVQVRAGSGEARVLAQGRGTEGERDALRAWVTLRAAGFEETGPESLRRWGLMPPEGEILWFGGLDTLAVVQVGSRRGDLRAVRVAGGRHAREGEVLLLPESGAGPPWDRLSEGARP